MIAALGCMAASCPHPWDGERDPEGPDIRVFFATDLEGYLEPCGCQARPLGGLDRAAALVARGQKTAGGALAVVGGSTFFRQVAIEETRVGQDRLRARTLAKVLERLGVAAVVPGAADLALGTETLRGLPLGRVALLASNATFRGLHAEVVREVGGIEVGLFGVADLGSTVRTSDPVAAARAAVRRLERAGARVVIGVVGTGRRTASQIAREVRGIDFLLVAGTGTQPPPPPVKVGERTTLLFGGVHGMGIGTLDLWVRQDDPRFVDAGEQAVRAALARIDRRIADLQARLTRWQGSGDATPEEIAETRRRIEAMKRERAVVANRPLPEGASSFVSRWEELGPERPRDPAVRNLIDDYDQALVEINRTALAREQVVPPVPGRPTFTGAPSCAPCHEDADRFWRRTKHAVAYATLVRGGKELDLDCVSCHVTGYRQPGGSTALHVGELKGVQCEACHGPSSQHVDALGTDSPSTVVRATPEATCLECHNTEHSDLFDFRSYLARIVGPGHGLPMPATPRAR